jgi:hypothetical protein
MISKRYPAANGARLSPVIAWPIGYVSMGEFTGAAAVPPNSVLSYGRCDRASTSMTLIECWGYKKAHISKETRQGIKQALRAPHPLWLAFLLDDSKGGNS